MPKDRNSDYPVLVAETSTIRKAFETIFQEKLSNVIIESDSTIVIQAITGGTKPPSQICDLIEVIIVLAEAIDQY